VKNRRSRKRDGEQTEKKKEGMSNSTMWEAGWKNAHWGRESAPGEFTANSTRSNAKKNIQGGRPKQANAGFTRFRRNGLITHRKSTGRKERQKEEER